MTTNPALAELEFLVGDWDMELSDTSFLSDPDAKVQGQVTFEWIEQGAALTMRMGTWRMWRDTPDFSQRFDAKVDSGQGEINGSWQKSTDGGKTWEHDFRIRYSRKAPR
jgi:hypothetical protein